MRCFLKGGSQPPFSADSRHEARTRFRMTYWGSRSLLSAIQAVRSQYTLTAMRTQSAHESTMKRSRAGSGRITRITQSCAR